jgi:hypothetical protein
VAEPRCRVHDVPLRLDLAGVLHCRQCRSEARVIETTAARADAARLACLPEPARDDPERGVDRDVSQAVPAADRSMRALLLVLALAALLLQAMLVLAGYPREPEPDAPRPSASNLARARLRRPTISRASLGLDSPPCGGTSGEMNPSGLVSWRAYWPRRCGQSVAVFSNPFGDDCQ